MKWVVDNWFLIVAFLAALTAGGYAVYRFFGLPTAKQIEKIKEWLVWACIEAEKALQSGTGQLKLREVWNMFCAVPTFAWVAKIITFDMFAGWVDDALITVKNMIASNDTLAYYVYGDNATGEVKKIMQQLDIKDKTA